MFKSSNIGIAALVFALTFAIAPKLKAAADEGLFLVAEASDDVFLDEGDGDFDTNAASAAEAPKAAPVVKQEEPKKEEPKKEEPKKEVVKEEPKATEPAPVVEQPAVPATDDVFKDDTPAQASEPAHVEKHMKTEKVVKHHEKKKAEKHKDKAVAHHKAHKAEGKGHFAYTTGECKLQRSPASEHSLGMTKASRKIWVVDVDDQWVKVWNKDGHEAFISRDCLK